MYWAYGVTTVKVPERAKLLAATLASLHAGGFDAPQIFIDGGGPVEFDNGWTCRVNEKGERLGAYGNWLLALIELHVRHPKADRYAVFQDDITCVKNLRTYLEHCRYPSQGYWNLYTFMENEQLVGKGWQQSVMRGGSGVEQGGRGAQALCFSREAVNLLLRQPDIAANIQISKRRIDGVVVDAMNKAGWREYVHGPSLVQHVGVHSTVIDKTHTLKANTYPGEEFDALTLLY